MNLHDGSSYWPTRDGLAAVFPPLVEDCSCDVVVVGAGITGSLVALELHARGLDVVVLDGRDVATGATAASTALLQYEIDELLIDLSDRYGIDIATTCYRESSRGVDLVADGPRRDDELLMHWGSSPTVPYGRRREHPSIPTRCPTRPCDRS